MVWEVDERDYRWWWPWATLSAVVFVLVFSCTAFATESEEVSQEQNGVEVSQEQKLDRDMLETIDRIDNKLTNIQRELESEEAEEEEGKESPELVELQHINESIGILIEQNAGEPLPEAQEPLRANGRFVSVAYANVSPTGSYATYAAGVLPKLGWNDDYVFWQESSQSYVFAWGDLSYSSQTFTGDNVRWLRWYWAGQSQGYVLEEDSGSLSLSSAGYTVLSNLSDYPTLVNSSEQIRREVMLYAVVTAAVFSLHHVWTYCIRNRNGTN